MNLEFKKRSIARLFAVQSIYLLTIRSNASLDDALQACSQDEPFHKELYKDLVQYWLDNREDIQTLVRKHLPERWSFDRLDFVLAAIVQTGVCELRKYTDLDTALILNEYIDIGHAFFQEGEHKLIHGILHGIAAEIRSS